MIEDNATMTREDRDELAAAASAADRRNRPTGLIVLGGGVLLIGLILVVVSFMSLVAARAAWSAQVNRVSQAGELAAEYQALQAAASDSSNIRVHDPIPTMGSDIGRLAQRAGVEVGIPNTTHRQLTTPGARTAIYSYDNITDESLSEILEWIDSTIASIPGMRADKITLRLMSPLSRGRNAQNQPTAQEWRMDVAFARTESTN